MAELVNTAWRDEGMNSTIFNHSPQTLFGWANAELLELRQNQTDFQDSWPGDYDAMDLDFLTPPVQSHAFLDIERPMSTETPQTPEGTHSRCLEDTATPMSSRTTFRLVSPMDFKATKARGSHSSEIWQSHKSTIKQLYLKEGRSLKDVIHIMQQRYNFKATEKMYKTRFRQWGFEKNNTMKGVSRMLLLKFQRDIAGKPSQFSRHGKEIDIRKYLRRKRATEYDVIDFEAEAGLSRAVKCRTPPPAADTLEYLRSPDAIRYQELLLHHARNLFWHSQRTSDLPGQPYTSSLLESSIYATCYLNSENTFIILTAEGNHVLGGCTDTGMLMRHTVFQRLHWLLEENQHNYIAVNMLFRMYEAIQPAIVLSVWKFVTAYWLQKNRHDPNAQLFEFLYSVLLKEGVSGLRALLENSCLQIVEEAEKVIGRDSYWAYTAWSILRGKFNAHATRRFEALLEGLEANHMDKRSHRRGSEAAVELMTSKCNLLRKINPISDAALAGWQEVQRTVTESKELRDDFRNEMLMECAYHLHRIHLRRGWDDDPKYNPRLQMAIHYLEERIRYREILSDEADSNVMDDLIYLEELYEATGWRDKAISTRSRRKLREAVVFASLQRDGVF